MMILQSILGLLAFTGLAWLISENRSKVAVKTVLTGLLVQLTLGFVLLKLPFFK